MTASTIDLVRLMKTKWENDRWHRIPFTRKYFRAFANGWWAEIEWSVSSRESAELEEVNRLTTDSVDKSPLAIARTVERERQRVNHACYYWYIYDRSGVILDHGPAGGRGLESLNREVIADVQNLVVERVKALVAGI